MAVVSQRPSHRAGGGEGVERHRAPVLRQQRRPTLMQLCNTQRMPWLAWTLHMRCPPNLLVDNSNAGCGAGMPLQLTPWGTKVKTYLAMPAGPA